MALVVVSVKPQSYYRLQYLPYLLTISTIFLFILPRESKFADLTRFSRRFTAILAFTVLLFVAQVLWITVDDLQAASRWYSTARFYQFRSNNFPDMQVANTIKDLAGDANIFVNGNRAWIYTLANKTSPTAYYYSTGMFARDYLSDTEFDATMGKLVTKPPFAIVYERGAPQQSQDFYNSVYISHFDQFVRSEYHICAQYYFTQTWPYSPHMASIHCLNDPSKAYK